MKDFMTKMTEWSMTDYGELRRLIGCDDISVASRVAGLMEESYRRGMGDAYKKVVDGDVTIKRMLKDE